MPVKVTCPNCGKVLNAPDAARGKAVKCSGCEGKVRVPAEGDGPSNAGAAAPKTRSGAQPAAKRKPAAADDDFLSGLDLSRAEDKSVQVCRKCGAEMEQGVLECPECGADPGTGQMKVVKKKLSKGQLDPSEFYGLVWRDSWEFLLKNREVGSQTAVAVIFLWIFHIASGFFASLCDTWPPMTFWLFIAIMCSLSIPGWFGCLAVKIIKHTVETKKKKLEKINFDAFAGMAFGLTLIAWVFAIYLQTVLLPAIGITMVMGSLSLGLALGLMGLFLLGVLPMPIALAHFAMPVTWKAWACLPLWRAAGRTVGPLLYLWVVLFVTYLPTHGLSALDYFLTSEYGLQTLKTIGVEWKEWSMKRGYITFFVFQLLPMVTHIGRDATAVEPLSSGVAWTMVCVWAGIKMAGLTLSSMLLVFASRAIGLFTVYHKDQLELITQVEDKAYVTTTKYDEFGKPMAQDSPAKKAAIGIGGTVGFYVIANVIVYFASGGKYVLMPKWLALALKIGGADAGGE